MNLTFIFVWLTILAYTITLYIILLDKFISKGL